MDFTGSCTKSMALNRIALVIFLHLLSCISSVSSVSYSLDVERCDVGPGLNNSNSCGFIGITKYRCIRIGCCFKPCHNCEADTALCYKPRAVPAAPTEVKLHRISSTAMRVSWEAPDFPGITGYKVYYNMFALPNMDKWLSVEVCPGSAANITCLEPDAVYALRVRARGSNGLYGNFSDIITSRQIPESPAMVQDFRAHELRPGVVELEWKRPSKPGAVQYQIRYGKVNSFSNESDQRLVYLGTHERTMTIVLDAYSVYDFNIRSSFGDRTVGPASHVWVATTIDDWRPAPTLVRMLRKSPTAMMVIWGASNYKGVTGYQVYYAKFGSPNPDKWPTVKTGPDAYEVTISLEPDVEYYQVRIRSISADGRFGDYSEFVSNCVMPDSPGLIQRFDGHLNDSQSVRLEWKPPCKPDVLRYAINYERIKTIRDEFGQEKKLRVDQKTVDLSKKERTLYVGNLMPNSRYEFIIRAYFKDYTMSFEAHFQVETSTDG